MMQMIDGCRIILDSIVDNTDVYSPTRSILLSLAASAFAQPNPYTNAKSVPFVGAAVHDMTTLSLHQRLVAEACDCSALYFVRELLPAILSCVVNESLPLLNCMSQS